MENTNENIITRTVLLREDPWLKTQNEKLKVRLFCENIFDFNFLKFVLILLTNKEIRDY